MDMPSRKILLVENGAKAAMELEEMLRGPGYIVMGLSFYGEETLRNTGDTTPDLILVDFNTREDADIAEPSEKVSGLYDIPVIYLTTHQDNRTFRRAMEMHPHDYLIRPFKERELYKSIAMAIYKHRIKKKFPPVTGATEPDPDTIFDTVITTDTDGTVIGMNYAAESMTGYGFDEVMDRGICEAFGVRTLATQKFMEMILQNIQDGDRILSWPDKIPITKKSGEEVLLPAKIGLIRDHGSSRPEKINFVFSNK